MTDTTPEPTEPEPLRYLLTFSLTPAQLGQMLPLLDGFLSHGAREKLATELSDYLWRGQLSEVNTMQLDLEEIANAIHERTDNG